MSSKYLNLRFILIDENSMVSAQLFGQLSKTVRKASGYEFQLSGGERAFRGVNSILLGDFWQLPPVSGTPLCAHCDEVPTGLAEHGYRLLWAQVAMPCAQRVTPSISVRSGICTECMHEHQAKLDAH